MGASRNSASGGMDFQFPVNEFSVDADRVGVLPVRLSGFTFTIFDGRLDRLQ
jgi:hypothetical protein